MVDPRSPFRGYVVELTDSSVFITVDLDDDGPIGVEAELMECAAYWVWECANHVGVVPPTDPTVELVLKLSSPESWRRPSGWSQSDPAVRVSPRATGPDFEITETFVALLQEGDNLAERELVSALLEGLFAVAVADLPEILDRVAPTGSKRMLNAFDQGQAPDMWAKGLPRPLTGHSQVTAQLLDDLGDWLRSLVRRQLPDGRSRRERPRRCPQCGRQVPLRAPRKRDRCLRASRPARVPDRAKRVAPPQCQVPRHYAPVANRVLRREL